MKRTSILAAISLLGAVACTNEPLDSVEQASRRGGDRGFNKRKCKDFNVSVEVPDVPGAQIFGQYCVPSRRNNGTVLLMVHTSWHNRFGWDPPNKTYSQVQDALDRGFTVMNIDRLGSGQSTMPASNLVTIDRNIEAIHGVAAQLRDGSLTGRRHRSMVWVGSSFGAMFAWFYAAKYPDDFDGFVLHGLMHRTKVSFAAFALSEAIISVCEDPLFSLKLADCGYLVNRFGFKGPLYYDEPNAAPDTITGAHWEDRLLRDVLSVTTLAESTPHVGIQLFPDLQAIEVDPATSPSQAITKPTLLVLGQNDPLYCGGPEGFVCNETTVRDFEAPYYTNASELDIMVPEDTGHVINLHLNGPASTAAQHEWIIDNIVRRRHHHHHHRGDDD